LTVPKATGWEKVSEIELFDATFWAPLAGVDDLTKNALDAVRS
jgi:hypothetical protein